MQNTTSEQISLKFQGSSTSLFTLAAANNTMIKTNAVQLNSFKQASKMSIVPNSIPQNKGKFVLNSGVSRSNQTRLMATPNMSADIKNNEEMKKAAAMPKIDSNTVKKVFTEDLKSAAANPKLPLLMKHYNFDATSTVTQKPMPPIVTPFHIENSSLAKGMWCKEDKNGVVSCEFEDCEIDAEDADKCKSEFEIEDILDRGYYEMIGEDYWGKEWDETYIYDFEKQETNTKDDWVPFASVIQMALDDFDTAVFCCKLAREGVNVKHLRMAIPGLGLSAAQIFPTLVTNNDGSTIVPPPICSQDYNEFNVELFYDFCQRNPFTGKSQSYMYPFVNLNDVDQKEMHKFVIGSWIENHKPEDVMKDEIMNKMRKAALKEIKETVEKQRVMA